MRKGSYNKCLFCKKEFYVFKSTTWRKYCSVKCYKQNTPIYNKGISKFKNYEEKRVVMLESGRKSYRKHIAARLFYYRYLSFIRRGMKGKFTKDDWDNLVKKQKNKCLECGINGDIKKLTIDHIIPISKWYEWIKINEVNYECNDIQNIQALCKSCNSKKSNKIENLQLNKQ